MQLLSGCERRLYDFIFALIGNFADADEIAQETKLRLWEQFDNYRAEADFAGWAFTIARYQVLDARKHLGRKARGLSEEFYEAIAAEAARHDKQELDDRQRALKLCLEKLPPTDRDFVMRCYDGQTSIKRVAESMERSTAGTYQLLWRLRTKLQKCIERRLAEDA
jgi:RNA polymerase sigma-70 factor (ECF subfamily)